MWRSLRKLVVLAVLPMFWQGCLSTGRDFPSQVEWIKKERTKKDDVKLVLGTPYAIGNSDGTATWTYAFYKYNPLFKTYYKELRFYWGDDNAVKSFTFNSSFPEDLEKRMDPKP